MKKFIGWLMLLGAGGAYFAYGFHELGFWNAFQYVAEVSAVVGLGVLLVCFFFLALYLIERDDK
jgi:hypothetical protein